MSRASSQVSASVCMLPHLGHATVPAKAFRLTLIPATGSSDAPPRKRPTPEANQSAIRRTGYGNAHHGEDGTTRQEEGQGHGRCDEHRPALRGVQHVRIDWRAKQEEAHAPTEESRHDEPNTGDGVAKNHGKEPERASKGGNAQHDRPSPHGEKVCGGADPDKPGPLSGAQATSSSSASKAIMLALPARMRLTSDSDSGSTFWKKYRAVFSLVRAKALSSSRAFFAITAQT